MSGIIGICSAFLGIVLAVMALVLATPLAIFLLVFTLVAFLAVFWIWMLVSAIQNRGLTDGEKTGWVLGIIFFHILGSLLYFFIGRPRRNIPRLAM